MCVYGLPVNLLRVPPVLASRSATANNKAGASSPGALVSSKLSKASVVPPAAPRASYRAPSAFIKGLYQYVINPACAAFFPKVMQRRVDDCVERALNNIVGAVCNGDKDLDLKIQREVDNLSLVNAELNFKGIVEAPLEHCLSSLGNDAHGNNRIIAFYANVHQYSLTLVKNKEEQSADEKEELSGKEQFVRMAHELGEKAYRNVALNLQKLVEAPPKNDKGKAGTIPMRPISAQVPVAEESSASALQLKKQISSAVQNALTALSSLRKESGEAHLEKAAYALMNLSFMISDKIPLDRIKAEIVGQAGKLTASKKGGLRGLSEMANLTAKSLNASVMLKVNCDALEKAEKFRKNGLGPENKDIDKVAIKVAQILEAIVEHVSENNGVLMDPDADFGKAEHHSVQPVSSTTVR